MLQGYDINWCKNPDRGLPLPDLTVYLDISIDTATNRSEFGEERYENSEFQEKVSKKYQQLMTDDWKVKLKYPTNLVNLFMLLSF